MGNLFSCWTADGRDDRRASTVETTSTVNDQDNTTETKQSTSRQRKDAKQEATIDGFGKFKLDVANMLALRDLVSLATYLCFAKGVIDQIERSKTPSLEMISTLESRGLISPTDISQMVDGLKKCDLAGIASNVQLSYQNHVSSGFGSQPITLKGKKDLFIKQLRRKYKLLYDSVQPLPYVKDRMCCVDKVFIQGNIESFLVQGGGNQTWQPLQSYHDILSDLNSDSTRCIILGEPGYGKSTLTLQFLYDWSNGVTESPLNDVDIVIFLRMRQLGGFTSIYEAIKRIILPSDSPLTVDDIKEILENTKSTVIIFDGYDEYPDKDNINTDFMKIMKMEKFDDTNVIITTRSKEVRHTPDELKTQSTKVQLTGFDEKNEDDYILKAVVGGDTDAARCVREQLKESPVLDDMCQNPLFFTIVAHVTHDKKNIIPEVKSVTWFFRFIHECFFKHTANKNIKNTTSDKGRHKLGKIAYEGLIKENQTIVWDKKILVGELGDIDYTNFVCTGILTEEEVAYVAGTADAVDFIQQKISVAFYHKLFLEYYAALYLVVCILGILDVDSAGSSSIGKAIYDLLYRLDSTDLQYLFRFASGLDAKAGREIIKYLVREAKDNKLAILCILEYNGEDGQIKDEVEEICSYSVSIKKYHSKILQRSTIQLLQIASRCDIPISELSLEWSFGGCDGNNIRLESGLCLPSLASIQRITIYGGWPLERSEDEVTGLIHFGLKSKLFKELVLKGCKQLPSSISPDKIPEITKSRDVKVLTNWSNLDLKSGKWKTPNDVKTITEMCSGDVSIDNNTSESVQRSAIELMVKASEHEIPILGVSLIESFNKLDEECNIILRSGLSLPILTSVQNMMIQTKPGRELNQQEVIGILNYVQQSQGLKQLLFQYCRLPFDIQVNLTLSGLLSRSVEVIWYSVLSIYVLSDTGNWLKGIGGKEGVLTAEEYEEEVKRFREFYRPFSLHQARIASEGSR